MVVVVAVGPGQRGQCGVLRPRESMIWIIAYILSGVRFARSSARSRLTGVTSSSSSG